MSKKIIISVCLVLVMVIFAGVFVLLKKNKQENNNVDLTKKTYINDKFNYSFEYPSEYNVFKISDAPEEFAKGDEPNVSVRKNSKDNGVFSIMYKGENVLNSDSIKMQFESLEKEDIDIISVTDKIYKVEFKKPDPYIISDFYYVNNSKNQTFSITVLKGNDVGNEIFSSLELR